MVSNTVAGIEYVIASAGDMNGDGLGDMVLADNGADPVVGNTTYVDAGAAYVVYGKTGTAQVNVAVLWP